MPAQSSATRHAPARCNTKPLIDCSPAPVRYLREKQYTAAKPRRPVRSPSNHTTERSTATDHITPTQETTLDLRSAS
ncbi:uncharacterized [Tachysurus ichikawai]